MEKVVGIILLGMAILVAFYIVTHLDKLNSVKLPIPQSITKYLKIQPFGK
jgi:hypothetical protein